VSAPFDVPTSFYEQEVTPAPKSGSTAVQPAVHGFLSFERIAKPGQQVVQCECGWRTHAEWAKGSRWQRQIESLRQHVISTWRRP
jgi:hypothetical protein